MKITYVHDLDAEGISSIAIRHILERKYLSIPEVVNLAMDIPFSQLPKYAQDADQLIAAIVQARLKKGV